MSHTIFLPLQKFITHLNSIIDCNFYLYIELNLTGWYGIYDQWQSLEWIQNNIEFFGGDKNQVTIGGQSAGAISIGIHLTSPIIKNKYVFILTQFLSYFFIFTNKIPFRILHFIFHFKQKLFSSSGV